LFHNACGNDDILWNKQQLVDRKLNAENVRISDAIYQAGSTKIAHPKTNDDLRRYKDKRGSYSKALSHKSNGMVKHSSFDSLIHALKSGKSTDFNKIILGGARHLVDPQGAYAYALEGADVAAYAMPKPPKLTSAQIAGEMVELYWKALLRDVPFNQYSTDVLATAAIADLNSLSNFNGPTVGNVVTPQVLFRGTTPGELVGPYISQFLYKPIPLRGKLVEQLYFFYLPGVAHNFLTDVPGYLLVNNGGSTGQVNIFQGVQHYIFTGRDLGTYVHKDYSSEAFVNAALILLGFGTSALDANNPYRGNPTQDGFVTYGGPKVIELVNIATAVALKACWYQKWLVHLRLRAGAFGFLVQEQKVNGVDFDLNSDVIDSPVLADIFGLYGTYLLPQMYPEGSPTHPSYPAGHAVIAGACVTILKAFFDENFVIPNPVQPNIINTGLEPYGGLLRVGDELNKLAGNIGMGRDFAGIHWRSDCAQGLLLGESIALSILQDEAYTNNESFKGFKVTKFDGKTITIGKKVTV